MNDTFSELISAMEDWNEARQELAQMRSEYTGYSPSYHLASWMDAAEKALERFRASLQAYVDEAVSKALEAERTRRK